MKPFDIRDYKVASSYKVMRRKLHEILEYAIDHERIYRRMADCEEYHTSTRYFYQGKAAAMADIIKLFDYAKKVKEDKA